MDLDFNSLMSAVMPTLQTVADAGKQAQSIAFEGAGIAEQRAIDAKATGEAAATVKGLELENQARQENERKRIAVRLGNDPTAAGWKVGELADRAFAADTQMQEASKKIQEIDSIGFLDNPLGWIAGQMQINEHIASYNAGARSKNAAEELTSYLSKTTSDAFLNSNAISVTTSEAYMAASKIVAAGQYNAQASDARLQAVRLNLEGIRFASEASTQQLQILFNTNTAQMQQKQYQMGLDHLQMAREEFNLKKRAFDEKMSEDSLILKYVHTGYFNQTGQRMDDARAKDVVMLYKAKQPDVLRMFDSGLSSAMLGRPVISSSPYDTATLASEGKLRLPEAQKTVADQLVTWRNEFSNQAIQTQYQVDPKDKSSAERAFNKFVADKLKNPESIPMLAPATLAQTTANNPKLGMLPVWQAVLGPAAKTGANVDDPNVAFGLITAAVQEKRLSYVDATDYANLAAGAVELNNQAKNLFAFGLPPVRQYRQQVRVSNMSMGKETANLADQKEFTRLLNKSLALDTYQKNFVIQDRPWGGAMDPLNLGNATRAAAQ